MLTLKEPVKAKRSNNYLAVLEDADGICHFWLPNGTYDGHDGPCGEVTAETETADHRETVS